MKFVLDVVVLGVVVLTVAAQENIDPTSPYPYLVGICATNVSAKCHGILVSENKVLTAGHCLVGFKMVRVYLADPGTDNSCTYKDHGHTVNSTSIKLHEKYEKLASGAIANDIAMIKLPLSLDLKNFTVGILTKAPLKTYFTHNITVHNSAAKDIRVEIGSEEKCIKIFRKAFVEQGQGCLLSEHEESFDENGFPLQINDTIFGYTTIDPLRKVQCGLFVDIFAHYKWIHDEINGARMTVGCFIMTLVWQIVLFIVLQ